MTATSLSRVALVPFSLASLVTGMTSRSAVLHAAAAVVLLLIALVLSVYKPRGLIVWGYRREPAGHAR